jgi:hypothetical protein
VIARRRGEADAFYDALLVPGVDADSRLVFRQALAGMLWSKQHYDFNLDTWLDEHGVHPFRSDRSRPIRNRDWFHMVNDDVISMPDKWEYPWFAAWDLAFHCVALAVVDVDFAKHQLELMLRDLYLHPTGQIPAYEWNFGDVNPPVHAWATLVIYFTEKGASDQGDLTFLKSAFQKLLVNFTWWLNRKDPSGRNVFEGGFLGLDNIGVFDRSAPLPTGGSLEQADGTAWMALYSQNMLEIALELAHHDPMYGEMALKFAEHFLWIAAAMDRVGDNEDEMWDERDGFFYDVLRFPDGSAQRLKVRSMVGLLSLCATTVIEADVRTRFPQLAERLRSFLARHEEVSATIAPITLPGVGDRRLLAVLSEEKLRRILRYVLDENEFLSPHGIRALSPPPPRASVRVRVGRHVVAGRLRGGRVVLRPLRRQLQLARAGVDAGERHDRACPRAVLLVLWRRLPRRMPDRLGQHAHLVRGESGDHAPADRHLPARRGWPRPVFGGSEIQQRDPHWRDHILFYEYFHGDNGAGLGASHQTGWTGVVARLIQIHSAVHGEQVLAAGLRGAVMAADPMAPGR